LTRIDASGPEAVVPDICVFFHMRGDRDTKKFWVEEKRLLQPTIVIGNKSITSMDLEIKNLIPAELAYLSDEVHFANGGSFMWDKDSIKAEMKNVKSDKGLLRIVYGYIDGHFRHAVCELVMPLPSYSLLSLI
jgi:hypothetical protein